MILIAFWFLARIVRRIAGRLLGRARGVSTLLKDVVLSWLARVIVIVGLVIAITTLGVDMTPVLAIIGAAGAIGSSV